MRCPELVADDLSGFWRSSKPGDRDATRGTDDAVSGGIGPISGWVVELRRSSGVVGDQRAAFPSVARPVQGGGAAGLIDRRRGRAAARPRRWIGSSLWWSNPADRGD